MLRRSALLLLCSILALTGVLAVPVSRAAAAGCPDVATVFARGTAETAPPIGLTGESFNALLRNRLPGDSLRADAVRYAASDRFNDREAIVRSVLGGVANAQRQITRLAKNCPRTEIVLGGYSQGALVAAYTVNGGLTLPARNAEYSWLLPDQLPADVADNIAAVVLFGPPSSRWLRQLGAPQANIDRAYRSRTVSYCIAGDPVCDGSPVGRPNGLHVLYSVNGMTDQAAAFAAARIR